MSNYDVVLTETAQNWLLDIVEYIAVDNPSRATSFIWELTHSLIDALSIFPRSCRVTNDYDFWEEIRIYTYGNYNSYYRVIDESKTIEVLFIHHWNRDINSFLRGL